MRLENLFESPDTQKGIEIIASLLMSKAITDWKQGDKAIHVYFSEIASEPGIKRLTGAVEDFYHSYADTSVSRSECHVSFFAYDMKDRSGDYEIIKNWIRIFYKGENDFKNAKSISEIKIHLQSMYGTLVHEIAHAYDAWASNYEHHSMFDPKSYEGDDHDVYMKLPHEINARFMQAVSVMRHKFPTPSSWKQYLSNFKSVLKGGQYLTPDEFKRIIKRLALEFNSERIDRTADITKRIGEVEAKLKNVDPEIRLTYKYGVIVAEQDRVTSIKNQDAILKFLARFADIYGKAIAVQDMDLNPNAKSLGFVSNKGRNKDFSFPMNTVFYRYPVAKKLSEDVAPQHFSQFKSMVKSKPSGYKKVLAWFKQNGFEHLGDGAFGDVFGITNKVVAKIWRNDLCYETYASFCLSNKGNPHVPRVGKVIHFEDEGYGSEDFQVMIMEWLKPLRSGNPEDEFVVKGIEAHIIVNHTGFSGHYQSKEYLKDRYGGMASMLKDRYPLLCKTIDRYVREFKHADCNSDIKIDNIMKRGDTYVITDPSA